MTQPGLSKNLRLIEDRLGVALFERSTSGVRLTAAGHLLVERGRQVLLDLSAIERDIDGSSRGNSGSVTVGLGVVVALELAGPLLSEVHRLYPGIKVDIVVSDPASLLDMLRDGRIDFGIYHLEPHGLSGEFTSRTVLRTRPLSLSERTTPWQGRTRSIRANSRGTRSPRRGSTPACRGGWRRRQAGRLRLLLSAPISPRSAKYSSRRKPTP